MPRHFTRAIKRQAFARANGHCESCGASLRAARTEYDHRVPYALSFDSSLANCAVLCSRCHAKKYPTDRTAIDRAVRAHDSHIGAKGPGRGTRAMPYGAKARLRKKITGEVVPRTTQVEEHARFMTERYFGERGQ